MKTPENDKWLDDALAEVIGSEKSGTDFEEWKQRHPETVEMLTSRADKEASASPSPLSIRKIIMKNSITKLAAVIAVVIGVGAIAVVGVNIGKYFYMGQDDAGVHIFYNEDSEAVVTLDDNEVNDVEQTRNDLQEIEMLRQQDNRKLIGVDELVANGKLERRVFTYQYQLSDGRTRDMREADELNFVLNQKQRQECIQCWHAGSGEDLGTYEQNVKGRLFVFKQKKFVLSDGTEIISSVGTPKDGQ